MSLQRVPMNVLVNWVHALNYVTIIQKVQMTTTYSDSNSSNNSNSMERWVIKIMRQVDVQSVSSTKSWKNCWQNFITKTEYMENSDFPGFFEIIS